MARSADRAVLLPSCPRRCRVTAAELCGQLGWLFVSGVPSWPPFFSVGPPVSVIIASDGSMPIPRPSVDKPDPEHADLHDPFDGDLALLHSAGSRGRVAFPEQPELFRWLSAGGVLS